DNLLADLLRKTVGVVEAEDALAGKLTGSPLSRLLDPAIEQAQAGLERAEEAVLLGPCDLLDVGSSRTQRWVTAGHPVDHDVRQVGEKWANQSQLLPVADGAAHHPPQDVAAPFVAGEHAVANQEHHGPSVVGEHSERVVSRLVAPVGLVGKLSRSRDDGQE